MIFVTGANGLVGSFIVRHLIEKGESIRALRRTTSDLKLLEAFNDKIDWIEGDLLDIECLNDALKGVDYVIHAAAIVSFDPSDIQNLYLVNVQGTANLVNACLEHSIKKLCHISSIAAIGRSKKELLINETTKWENSQYNTHYAKSKYLAELEVWRGIEEGLEAVILNPTIVLGPGDWQKSSAKMFKQVWRYPTFYPHGFFHYIDVRDVADVAIKLLFSEVKNERFILDTGQVSYFDFFQKVTKEFHLSSPKYQIPRVLVSLIWRFEKIRSLLTIHKPLITKETARAMRNHFQYDNQKIHQFIEHQFHTMNESVEWTCKELKNKYKI